MINVNWSEIPTKPQNLDQYPIIKLAGKRMTFKMVRNPFEFMQTFRDKTMRRFQLLIHTLDYPEETGFLLVGPYVIKCIAEWLRQGYSPEKPFSILKTGEGMQTKYDIRPEHELSNQPAIDFDYGKRIVQEVLCLAAKQNEWDLQKQFDVLCEAFGVEVENCGDVLNTLYDIIESQKF